MKKQVCPLCGLKEAITRSDSEMVTHIHPSVEENNIGNYTMGYTGGDWDLSHAEVCPQLKLVRHKKDLLGTFVGANSVMRSDLHTYFDYVQALLLLGLFLKIEVFQEKENNKDLWEYFIFVERSNRVPIPNLIIDGHGPGEVFNIFRHRLLCGETITLDNGDVVQLQEGLGPLRFMKV